MNQYIVLVFW